MANSFNTDQTSITSASTDITVFTATASTTLIKSVRVVHASGTSSATLSIIKSGSATRSDMNTVALTQNELTDLISDVLPLESGDVIKVRTSHQPSEVFVSYVENTTSVSAQSIDVLSDVDITTTAPTNGQTLVWNSSAGEFEPGDAGGSTATLDDIGNVDTTGKSTNDVLLWNGSNWVDSNRLTELYTQFRSGTNTNIYADGSTTTEGKVELSATGADLKVNITGIEVTETSPGDIEMVVATDASGTTAFTAVHIDGTTTANSADVLIKNGANLKIESANSTTANLRYTGTGNANLSLPTSTGTLALTSDLYTDTDADARIAAASVTDLTDVTSAGSGAIITSTERTKLSGIATGAEVNVQSDWNATSGDALILNKPTIPSNTNLANTNLTADNNRTYDTNGNTLTIDINGGDFALSDSSSLDTYIQAGTNLLELGDAAMTVQATGKFYADAGIEHDEAGLTAAGAYGAGSEITYLGSAATATTTGRIYYYNGTTWAAYTTATEAPQKALLGIALGTTMAKGFLIKGFVNPNGATGFTAASPVYGATNSSATTTAPTTGFQRVMGNSISTSVIFFNPSSEYIELT